MNQIAWVLYNSTNGIHFAYNAFTMKLQYRDGLEYNICQELEFKTMR